MPKAKTRFRVKEVAQSKGITFSRLQQLIVLRHGEQSIAVATLENIWSSRSGATIESLRQIAEALGCTVDDLLEQKEKPSA